MSSDNYEVPQIVKPAVAVSPLRDPLVKQRDATRFSIESSQAADRNLIDSASIITTDGFISANRGNLIISKILKVDPAVVNAQQKALLLKQKTPDGIRSIRKALMPQNEPMLYDQSTTGHRELMDKLKAPEANISLVPTPVTHDPRLHCSFQSNESSRIQHPVQLRHYVEHTSHEVTPIRG
ncbi:hypothetical protein CRE_01167 [Caenorhabditis remanei]|uniref:Uncharacterized protein n=1 Tax=Caenorhabditis remanei TaxID=31234 RepID=E3MWL2_CAERE|nr:hypothetical protein CRE_01167 [Caenorhabditis remanei]